MSMHGQTPKQVPYADLKVGQKYHVRYEAAGTSIDLTGTIAIKDERSPGHFEQCRRQISW